MKRMNEILIFAQLQRLEDVRMTRGRYLLSSARLISWFVIILDVTCSYGEWYTKRILLLSLTQLYYRF